MTYRMTRARLVTFLIAASLALPSVAFADETKAVEYYEQATQAYQAGDLEKAADLLNKAYAEDPDLVYQYNRILALEGLGRYEEALQVAAALEAPMKADPKNRFSDISEVRAKLEAAVAKQKAAADQERAEEQAEAAQPETTTDEEQFAAEEEIIQPPVEEPGPNVAGIALVAGGGVLVVPGVLFLSGTLMSADAAKCYGQRGATKLEQAAHCLRFAATNGGTTAQDGFASAEKVVNTHRIAGISLLGAGVVAAGIGAVLLATGGSEPAPAADSGARGPRFAFAPWFSGDGAGAVFDLRF